MAVKTLSVWDGVPDSDTLKDKLRVARDAAQPLADRQQAVSYLTGATKVLAGIEKRHALADYLARQLKSIKATLYLSGDAHVEQTHR